jgi:Flp pilus assembly protein TadG
MLSRLRKENGQAAVELALVLPILATILYVMFQFGQVFLQYQEVSGATSEGARRASNMATVGEPGRTSTIVATVRNGTSLNNAAEFDSNALSVAISSTWTPGSTVTVTSTYPASVTILGVTLFSGNLTTKRTARILN